MGYRTKERARPQELFANGQRLFAKAKKGSHELHQLMAAQKESEEKGRRPVNQKQHGRPASLESWLHDDVPGSQNADTAVSSLASSDHLTLDKEPNRPDKRQPALIIVEDNKDDFILLKRALWKSGATARVWARSRHRPEFGAGAGANSLTDALNMVPRKYAAMIRIPKGWPS